MNTIQEAPIELINRRKLVQLIHELGQFTERELVERFSKMTNGNLYLGEGQTIRDFLEELTELGTFKRRDDHYWILK